jgi:hypothetical protein
MRRLSAPSLVALAIVGWGSAGVCGAAEYEWQFSIAAFGKLEALLQRPEHVELKSGWKCDLTAPSGTIDRETSTTTCRKNSDLVSFEVSCEKRKPSDRVTVDLAMEKVFDFISVGCFKRP